MKDVIIAFVAYLAEKELVFSAVVVGGAALILLNLITRATRDVDCLDPEIPEIIKAAALEFSRTATKFGLKSDWLNNGPSSLKLELPEGWLDRVIPLYSGKALTLFTLGRKDLLRSKLYAYCDRQQDLADCLALKPSLDELDQCLPWLLERDANPLWPEHVRISIDILKARTGDYDGLE